MANQKMGEASPLRIIACGDVKGQFKTLYSKLEQLNSKAGPFEMCLCVGEFFDEYVMPGAKIFAHRFPIPVYILGPCGKQISHLISEKLTGAELETNLFYLGQKGLLTTPQGLTIAYLSGIEQEESSDYSFNLDSFRDMVVPIVSSLNFKGVDILLTSPWPKEVSKYDAGANALQPVLKQMPTVHESCIISQLAYVLKPRYHFAAMNQLFYERQPYRNHRVLQEPAEHTTRFIGLGVLGNKLKQKAIYAFNCVPMRNLERSKLCDQPLDATECPYSNSRLEFMELERQWTERKALGKTLSKDKLPMNQQQQQYFFDNNADSNGQQDSYDQNGRYGKRRRRDFAAENGHQAANNNNKQLSCWFCLSSPDVEKHLIATVGEQCYLARAKGGLTDDHVLILPISHVQSQLSAPLDLQNEIDSFVAALSNMYRRDGKCAVFFERNYKTQHMQIQCVPLPQRCADAVKEAFLNTADLYNIILAEMQPADRLHCMFNHIGLPYFYVLLPNGEQLLCRNMKQFPLQFGREVLASPPLLNMPKRIDWRDCVLSVEEEEKMTDLFRKQFAPFDFTAT